MVATEEICHKNLAEVQLVEAGTRVVEEVVTIEALEGSVERSRTALEGEAPPCQRSWPRTSW